MKSMDEVAAVAIVDKKRGSITHFGVGSTGQGGS